MDSVLIAPPGVPFTDDGLSRLPPFMPTSSQARFTVPPTRPATQEQTLQKPASSVEPAPAVEPISDETSQTGENAKRKYLWPSDHISETADVAGYTRKDRFQVRSFLVNRETQLFAYPVLMWFTEMEFTRSARYNKCFSFVVLQVGIQPERSDMPIEPLAPDSLALLGTKIMDIKRSPDLMGHFAPAGLAILMPETEPQSADKLAIRIAKMIDAIEPDDWTNSRPLRYRIGFAGAPDQATTLPQLLAEAVKYQIDNGRR